MLCFPGIAHASFLCRRNLLYEGGCASAPLVDQERKHSQLKDELTQSREKSDSLEML